MPPARRHQVPLNKVADMIGADAVMFLTFEQYGSKYQLDSANSIVTVSARLVDTRSGICYGMDGPRRRTAPAAPAISLLIWYRRGDHAGDDSKTDSAHAICPQANVLLYGP